MISNVIPISEKQIGVASDHGGFELKEKIIIALKELGYKVVNFGAKEFNKDDDYPDLIVPLAKSVSRGEVSRGLALCGSGVGACITANKIPGVRASLIMDPYTARQSVEDDNLNIICLGGNVIGFSFALELILIFLKANFKSTEQYMRRLNKISKLECERLI